MLKKQYFNMIEVMLAIVIITVGLASVFILFPAGLNAHKKAVADNSVADLAELIFSSIRAQIDVDSSSDGKSGGTGGKFGGSWAGYENSDSDTDVVGGDESEWKVFEVYGDSHSDVAEASLLRHKTKANVFWVRQISGTEDNRLVDFSAIGRVYVDRSGSGTGMENEYFCQVSNGNYKKYSDISSGNAEVNVKKFLLPMILEISYPAEKEYAQRQKQYFRFEIFNEHYEQERK